MSLNKLSKIPLPICGLALGSVALGNLLSSHSLLYKSFFSLISAVIIFLVVLSFIVSYTARKEQLQNGVVASVFATFFMSIGLLSANIVQYVPEMARLLWVFAILGHLVYAIYFSFKFTLVSTIEQVLPSWFIVYVGFVASGNVSGVFGYPLIGRILVMMGIIGFIVIMILNLLRIKAKCVLAEPIRPLNSIFAAPLNLCIVGYLTLFKSINDNLLILLVFVSVVIFIMTITNVLKLQKNNFHPSFAAFTFPLVISVIAYKLVIAYFELSLIRVINVLEIASALVVVYVMYRYARYLRTS